MVRSGRLHPPLALIVIGLTAFASLCAASPPLGRILIIALATWALVSLPVGLLVGHYCALADEPAL